MNTRRVIVGFAFGTLLYLLPISVAQAITPDLRRAASQYDAAQITGDQKLLNRLLAADYVLVNSSGATETKEQFIADLTDPSYHLSPYTVLKPVERQWASGAVLGGVSRLAGTDHGHAFDVCLRFSDVWAKRNGRWQVIYTQAARAGLDECR